jgi:hypothetical protein
MLKDRTFFFLIPWCKGGPRWFNRQQPRLLGARVDCVGHKGGQGDHEGVLTGGGDVRRRPESKKLTTVVKLRAAKLLATWASKGSDEQCTG